MIPLAEASPFAVGELVLGLNTLLTLGVAAMTFSRKASGKEGERQIEPTALAAMGNALRDLQEASSRQSRELGEMSASVRHLAETVADLRSNQRDDIVGAHRRLDSLSTEVGRHAALLEEICRSCPAK
jgi:hypothetical protein